MRFDYIFKETPQIKEAQVVQNQLGKITFNIVRRDSYSVRTEKKILEKVAEWISPDLVVDFEYISEIPREGNGKFRAVKSNLQ